jgi:hypothetical protein
VVWCGGVGAAARLRHERAGGPNLTTSQRIETGLTLFESGNVVGCEETDQSESNSSNLKLVVVFEVNMSGSIARP